MSPRRINGALSYTCVKDARRGGCGRVGVRMEPLVTLLDELLMLRVEAIDLSSQDSPSSDRRDSLEQEVSVYESRSEDLADEYGKGRLSAQAYTRATRVIEGLKTEALDQLRVENDRINVHMNLAPQASDLRDHWHDMTPSDRNLAAKTFVKSVSILPVRVRGRNSFDPERVHVEWQHQT